MNRLVLKLYTVLTGLLMMQEIALFSMLGRTSVEKTQRNHSQRDESNIEIDWLCTVICLFLINLYDLVAKYNELMYSTLPIFFSMNYKTIVYVCDIQVTEIQVFLNN